MTDTDPAPRPATRRVNWLLTGSLMLNTLLVGLFIGQLIAGGPPGAERGGRGSMGPPPRSEAQIAARVLDSVEPEARPELREAFKAAMREARPRFADRRQAQRALREAMIAEPFDADRLTAAFAELRTREAATEAAVQAALVDQFTRLTPEQRRAVADALDRGRRGKPGERLEEWRKRRDGAGER